MGIKHMHTVPLLEWEEFEELYQGLLEANENGTGYSPRVAQAMKSLKELRAT